MALHGIKNLTALLALFIASNVASAGSPHYADFSLSDTEDGDSQTSFEPDTPKIFLHAGLVEVADGAKLSSSWIAEDTNGAAPANYKIDSVDLTVKGGINVATFSMTKPTKGWPKGTYRVDLFIDGKAAGAMHFKIVED